MPVDRDATLEAAAGPITTSPLVDETLHSNGQSSVRPRLAPSLAVIIPATDRPATLGLAVEAIRAVLAPGDELIVVTEPARCGPAAARNAGARQASADVLVFVDSDVVVHRDALAHLRLAFGADPTLTALFGSYDDGPASPGLVSQFRNLLHHHVHQQYPGVAATFWSGLGAVRRAEFLLLGGFDTDRFSVPAVEDIDLGMRLRAMGGRIELHPVVQGTHLKRWTLASMIHTDFHRRGVPWTLICIERRSLPRTLNLSWRERTSAALVLLTLGSALRKRRRAGGAALLALISLNGSFYWLLYRRMGIVRATIGIGLHAIHRLVGVAAVPSGMAVYMQRRRR